MVAASPGSQPWPLPPPSSSRLRGNKDRSRSRSSGVVSPLRPLRCGHFSITPRLRAQPPPPPARVRALGPPRRSGPLPGPCRRPGPPPLGLSLRTASALWAPSTPLPVALWRAAAAFAAPTAACPMLPPPPAAPTWLPAAAMVRSASAPNLRIRWYSPLRMAALTAKAVFAIFIEGKARALPTVLNWTLGFPAPGPHPLLASSRGPPRGLPIYRAGPSSTPVLLLRTSSELCPGVGLKIWCPCRARVAGWDTVWNPGGGGDGECTGLWTPAAKAIPLNRLTREFNS